MEAGKMNAILAEMTPREIRDALWMIEVFERAGGLRANEAAELRWRVVAWQAFNGLEKTTAH